MSLSSQAHAPPGTRIPLGQVLVVTAGVGWVQRDGGPVEEMRPGDVIWIPPGLKHWHGASATTGVTHIALTEAANGQVVNWLEQVSNGAIPPMSPGDDLEGMAALVTGAKSGRRLAVAIAAGISPDCG